MRKITIYPLIAPSVLHSAAGASITLIAKRAEFRWYKTIMGREYSYNWRKKLKERMKIN